MFKAIRNVFSAADLVKSPPYRHLICSLPLHESTLEFPRQMFAFINALEPRMLAHACDPALGRLRQDIWKFQTNLGWEMRPCLRTKQKKSRLKPISRCEMNRSFACFPRTQFLVEISQHSLHCPIEDCSPVWLLISTYLLILRFSWWVWSCIIALKSSILKYSLHTQRNSGHC